MAVESASKHPNLNLLLFFNVGMVSEEMYDEIEGHLKRCEECLSIGAGLKSAFQDRKKSGYEKDLSHLVWSALEKRKAENE